MLAWLVLQGLKESRKLKHGALSLHMGNGMHAVVEAIKSFDLILPSGLIINEVENLLSKKIKAIRSDRGGEYLSHAFVNHMKSCSIVYQLTPPYTPQHNGVSKRKNWTLLDMVRSMMNLTTLPKSFWGYALKTASHILNMVPTKKVDRKPYEIWHVKYPKLSYLRVWGYEALVKRDTPNKLDSRSIKCIFVGYPKEMMGYYFYYPLENKIFVSRNAEFFENSFMIVPTEVESQNVGVPIHRSARIPQVPDRYGNYVDIEEYEIGDLNEPPNYKAALADLESDKWLEAMNMKMQSMKDNQVWYLVDLLSNGRTVGCKWLFKKKTDMDGNIHTFKAHLVAKGLTQTYGVDYRETFSPVTDIRAIRILLAIAVFYDYEIWQMNVKTTFLNGHLSKDVYMVQPERVVDPNHPNKVCKLQRSICGLKQASRSWNKRFDEEIKKIRFTQNPDEPCVYLKASGSNVAFLVLYVDDILLMRNSIAMLQEVKSWLCKCFSIKDLGEAAYILGIKIIRNRPKRLIALSQSAYLEKTLKKFRMENSNKRYTLMMENLDYRKSQVKTILKYLRNTKDMVLVYGAKPEDELKKSAKQSTNVMSSIEDEYIDAAEPLMEAIWMRKFINGLGDVMPSNKRPMEMLCDNEPALAIARDPKILKGARNFQRKYQNIHKVIQRGEIVLKKVHTYDNVADPFTKPMSLNKHFEHAMSIGIVPASSLI
ncbi:retrotransposon protein, putative, ty1-copia subclass [Tanacetum coccineum]